MAFSFNGGEAEGGGDMWWEIPTPLTSQRRGEVLSLLVALSLCPPARCPRVHGAHGFLWAQSASRCPSTEAPLKEDNPLRQLLPPKSFLGAVLPCSIPSSELSAPSHGATGATFILYSFE